jgi:hypothetical protein
LRNSRSPTSVRHSERRHADAGCRNVRGEEQQRRHPEREPQRDDRPRDAHVLEGPGVEAQRWSAQQVEDRPRSRGTGEQHEHREQQSQAGDVA